VFHRYAVKPDPDRHSLERDQRKRLLRPLEADGQAAEMAEFEKASDRQA
jgi:hypothetical protein